MLILLLSLLVILIIILKNKKIETFQNINYNQIILNRQKIKNKIKYDYEKIKLVYEQSNKNPLVLFEIKNNIISLLKKKNINPRIHRKRITFIKTLIEETLKKYNIHDMIFIVNLSDRIPDIDIPFLGSVFQKDKNSICVPLNWGSYFGNNKYEYEDKKYNEKVQEYKNTNGNRSDKIVFRGSNNCKSRRKLLKIGYRNNNMDVKLPKGKKDKNFIPNKDIRNKYKYFFIIRGRGKWTGSLNQFALANGVLFIIEEDTKQPFELLLEPNEDYISIKNDLSDIGENVGKINNIKLMDKMKKRLQKKTKFYEPDNLKNYIYLCLTNLYN